MFRKFIDAKFAEVKFVDSESTDQLGTFSGLASVYGVTDLHGDIVMPGAFAQTIQERAGRVKLLWQHDVTQPIGTAEIADSEAGLVVKGRLSLSTERGREAWHLMRDGVVDAMSIGYDTVESNKGKAGVREITQIKLWEVSLVTFPANTLARVATVKAFDALKALNVEDQVSELAAFVAAFATETAIDTKAGRVLSARNLELLKQAMDAISGLLAAAAPESTEEDQPKHVEPEVLASLHALFANAGAVATATR